MLNEEKRAEYIRAARGFESMFVSMMWKQMRESMVDDGEEKTEDLSFGADTLQGLADMQFGDYVAGTGRGMGIAEVIYKRLTGGESMPLTTVRIPNLGGSRRSANAHEFVQENQAPIREAKAATTHADLTAERRYGGYGNIEERAAQRMRPYEDIIVAAGKKYDIDPKIIRAVITAESAGRHDAVSSAGAKGLMQLMDGTAAELGVNNVFDPKQNIEGGVRYLRKMLNEFGGDLQLALAGYNAGAGNVRRHGGIPPFKETRNYVQKIARYIGDSG